MSTAIAHEALNRLLERAERASARKAQGTVSLSFTKASFAPYLALTSHASKSEAHATLREAERAGAVHLDWDPLAGADGQVQRVRLASLGALAQFLSQPTRGELIGEAHARLAEWKELPRVQEILKAWSLMRTVRGRDVPDLGDLADALRVIDFCQERADEDIAVRSASAALFKNSKRIEELEPWLDILTADAMQGLRRTAEEVFAGLGLVKYPPAAYLAGHAQLALVGGTSLAVPAPFIGLAPATIQSITVEPCVRAVMTVENLTVFHELAAGRAGSLQAHLILFTAGMPAPSFLKLYARLLERLRDRLLYHFGDIDPGGYRVAECLARTARATGHSLRLWQMRADAFAEHLSYRALKSSEIAEMRRICDRCGWAPEAQALSQAKRGFEQEALPLRLPDPAGEKPHEER